MKNKPKVSILCAAYNQKDYIKKTIDSFLMQKTNFEFEIIINDDASTDGTTQIIKDYHKKYPKLIKPIFQKENQYSKKDKFGSITERFLIPNSSGKYVAFCEGDDYWTDEFKLQKQFDFMENNPEFSVCFGKVSFLNNDEIFKDEHEKSYVSVFKNRSKFSIEDIIENNFIATCSVMYRRKNFKKFPEWTKKMPFGDWWMHVMHAQSGKIKYINQPMAVYRIHKGGVWSSKTLLFRQKAIFDFYKYLSDELKNKYDDIIIKNISETAIYYTQKSIFKSDPENNIEAENTRLKEQINNLNYHYGQIINSKKWKLIYKIDQHIRGILSKNLFIRKIARHLFNRSKTIYSLFKNFIIGIKDRVNELKRKKIIIKNKSWTNDGPLVSVVIPSFNYGKYINETITSVLNQTFLNFEIIIVDSSTDQNSINVLKNVNHNKINVIFREGKHLVGDNRNYGINKSKGKYICCLDADDKIKETYLEKALYLLESENLDIVSTSLKMFDQDDKTFYQVDQPSIKQMLNANHIFTVAIFKKSIWQEANGYYDFSKEKSCIYEDWDFWVRCIALGARVRNIIEPLMLYRIHGHSLSNNPNIIDMSQQSKIIKEHNKKLLTKKNINYSLERNSYKYIVKSPFINLENQEYEKSEIIFAIPYTILGGADKVFLQLLSTFKNLNLSPSVFTTEVTPNKSKNTIEEYEKITSKIYDLPQFIKNKNDWLKFVLFFIKTRNIKCIYLANSHYFYKILPDIKKEFPKIKIIDHHFNTDVHFSHNRKYSKYIDHSITESQFVVDEFVKKYKENSKNISLIANGIDTNKLFNPISYTKLKKPELLSNNKKIISFIGRISPEKGPDLFLKIANEFKDNKNLLFVIAGPGPIDDYMNQSQLNNKYSNVIYLGIVNSAELLYFTDILLLPSIIDGRPIVVLEAMSMNKAIVASNIGSLPHLIEDKKNGLLCEPGSVDQFVKSIKFILDNPNFSKKIGDNARKFAVENLDQKNLDETYQKLLQRFIK